MTSKPKCKYGAGCYRKNPKHLREFFHGEEKEEMQNELEGSGSEDDIGASTTANACVPGPGDEKNQVPALATIGKKRQRNDVRIIHII